MSCGCQTSDNSTHTCGTKSANGCESIDTCGNSFKLNVFDWLANIPMPKEQKYDFVEVRFKNERKSFYKNIHHLNLHIGSIVTVESASGHDIGVVSLTGELVRIQMKKKKFSEELFQKIYRISTQKDIEIWQEARNKENEVKTEARKIAHKIGLSMKITDIEFQGDGTKATFYYTAETRIDFRILIKELAAAFHTKIDMKQIGFRQEAAKIGGIGSCGRELCCSSWLTDFRSVNTNAARYQQLSINPQKLAGQCGKLKCCLNYELDSYLDILNNFPPSNTTLDTEKGRAYCIKIDVLKKKMWFTYADNPVAWHDLSIDDVKHIISQNSQGEKSIPLEDFKVEKSDFASKNIDLIQENNVNRFEKKNNQKNRKKPDNRNKRPDNGNNKPKLEAKPQTNNTKNNTENPKTNNEGAKENINNLTGENKPKKHFKKYKPKPKN